MRTLVGNQQATLLFDAGDSLVTLQLSVLSPNAVWFSTIQGDLDNVDSTNSPTSGWTLDNSKPILVIPYFRGKLYARTNVASAPIDVEKWSVCPPDSPQNRPGQGQGFRPVGPAPAHFGRVYDDPHRPAPAQLVRRR